MQEVIRVPKPIINIEKGDYEVRWDSSYYGIGHYAVESSKSKREIIKKLKKILKGNRRSHYVVIKTVATAHSETEIKDYEKLPQFKFAVFNISTKGLVNYYGITFGVDRNDALNHLSTNWPLRKNRLKLLRVEENQIVKNRFYNSKVVDQTTSDEKSPGVKGTQRVLYDKIKGVPSKEEIEEEKIDEDSLY